MSKIYVQTPPTVGAAGDIEVKDTSGALVLLSAVSPLLGSPIHLVDDRLGDPGLGIDGTGPYFDPNGAIETESAELQLLAGVWTFVSTFSPEP